MRKVFYSFHYDRDSQRVAQVKNAGVLEGQPILNANKWEEVEAGGDPAIEAWIEAEMKGKSCLVVLIGAETAGRRWVNHEIVKAWNDGKGVVGVYIHGLKNLHGQQDVKGANPFDEFKLGDQALSSVVKAYDPPHFISTDVFAYIKENLPDWVEEAIRIRGRY